MSQTARYALYFAPPPDSPCWCSGAEWFGRDPASDAAPIPVSVKLSDPDEFARLIKKPARYGFHATLKAPFQLIEGASEAQLEHMAQSFAASETSITLPNLQLQTQDGFLSLRVGSGHPQISDLAQRCVAYFDDLRMPASEQQLQQRRQHGISQRQDELLQRWGYPYTEEQFKFHISLTDRLDGINATDLATLLIAAETHFAGLLSQPSENSFDATLQSADKASLSIDALSIFKENYPGAAFKFWRRFAFRPA